VVSTWNEANETWSQSTRTWAQAGSALVATFATQPNAAAERHIQAAARTAIESLILATPVTLGWSDGSLEITFADDLPAELRTAVELALVSAIRTQHVGEPTIVWG
jgi:hypothetical protein